MMREFEFVLDEPVDGIDRLFFYAPSYGAGRKFAVKAERILFEIAKNHPADKVKDVEPDEDWKEQITDAQFASMFTMSDDYEDLLEAFVTACAGSSMCKANGNTVPRKVFDAMDYSILKRAFGGYVKRFLL